MIFVFPGPRQQFIEAVDGMPVDHAREHVAQVGVGFDAVEFAGLDQRADDCPSIAATVTPGKEMVLAPECNRPVILPMSGRRSRSIIPGTHSMDAAFDASMSSGALVARSFTSRWRPA